jgi:uncharacterized membrane protein YfcA
VAELIAALAGFAIGVFGTLIGAGGGFLIVPIVALLEPEWSTHVVTGFSLAVVAANATTGGISYARRGRVDGRSFAMFAAAAAPGALLGPLVSAAIPRRIFDALFGVVLVAIAVWLFVHRRAPREAPPHPGHTHRVLVDREGTRYEWSFDPAYGLIGSALVGFVSSLLGIGGGIVHVPLLVALLSFPEHIATATSHAVLAVTAVLGTVTHLVHGDYAQDGTLVITCALGAILGAPLGARLSTYVSGRTIMRILAGGLAVAGLRLLFRG